MRVRSDASSPTCRPLCWLPASGAALLLAACGGGGSDTAPPPPSAITLTLGADDASLTWNKAFTLKVLANDSASRGALTLVSATTPAHGTVKVVGSEIEYTPAAGYVGADSFSYTVKADDGVSASATASLKVLAALTLKGMVSDGPIANAQVTAKVGSQEFKASADAQGAYSITVQTDKPGDAVLLNASGVGAQSMVKLQSLLGDLASLAKQADKDGVLAPAQSNATLVSHYSTALAALVSEANGKQPPATLARINELSRAISAERLLDIATAIKLVVDQGTALPQGIADTQALAQAPQASISSYLSSQATAKVDAVRTQVQAGTGLPAGPAFAPAQPLTLLSFSAQLGSGYAQQFGFKPDGSASVLMPDYAGAASWSASDGVITITLASPQSVSGTSDDIDPRTGLQTDLRFDTLGFKLRQVAGGPDGGSYLISTHTRELVLSGPDKDQIRKDQWSGSSLSKLANLASLPAIINDFKVGDRFGGVDAPDGSGADIMELTGAATAKLLRSGTALSWRVADGRFTVQAGGFERSYLDLGIDGGPSPYKSLIAIDSRDGAAKSIREAKVSTLRGELFQADASLYKRWSSGFNAQSAVTGTSLFFDLAAGGSGNTVSITNGVESKSPLSWSINPDGSLRMLRSGGRYARDWLLLQRNGASMVVLESQRMVSDGSLTIPWRLNVYTDTSAPANGAAALGQLLSAKGEQYPLRVNFTLDAQGKITGGDYDFHGLNGTMTPCTWSQANTASCLGANGSITPKVQQGGPLKRDTGSAAVISLVDGPNDYGYTFTGTLDGLFWSGSWTKVAVPNSTFTDAGTFSVKVGIR